MTMNCIPQPYGCAKAPAAKLIIKIRLVFLSAVSAMVYKPEIYYNFVISLII